MGGSGGQSPGQGGFSGGQVAGAASRGGQQSLYVRMAGDDLPGVFQQRPGFVEATGVQQGGRALDAGDQIRRQGGGHVARLEG